MDERYQYPLPYPPPEVCRPDPAWVPLLKELYSGQNGELGAVAQYCYQSQVLERAHREVARILQDLAMVEMRHLRMLGRLIVLCGGTPDYTSGSRRHWWSASSLSYRKDLGGALLASLAGEVAAVDAYLKTASSIRDPRLQEALRRIALDESQHADLLRGLITRFFRPYPAG